MGICPVGKFNDDEEEVQKAENCGWKSMNDSVSTSKKYFGKKALQLWPDGIVPYVIGRSLEFNRWEIERAMDTIEKNSRFQFVEKSHQRHFLKFTRQDGCYYTDGGNPLHPKISLGMGCESYHTILHELLHSLGFPHEQRRPDRDEYITIHWKNITKGESPQFYRLDSDEYPWTDLEFDYDSIMLYSSYAFSKNDRRTIETKDGSEIFQNEELSDINKKKLRRL